MSVPEREFKDLKNIFIKLRSPEGCEWDREQTYASLLSHLREEVEEYAEAVNMEDPVSIEEELGDILLHVMFAAEIARERGDFDIDSVIARLSEKLVRRHPHVFSGAEVAGIDDIKRNWEEIKKNEKKS